MEALERVQTPGEGSGAQVLWGVAEGTGIVQSGEKEAQGRLHCSLQQPERRSWQAGSWPLLPRSSDRTRGDGLKFCPGLFRLAVRNNSFSQRAVRQWHSCPGSGGVTVPGGVPEPWGCGTAGRGKWAILAVGRQLILVILGDLSGLFQP